MRVEKTDSTSRLSKFKAVCTTSSSELPQATVTGSPDFKTKGLAIAGLNFVGNAHYKEKQEGKDNVAQFELIPWILSQCSNVNEAS